VLLLVKTAGGSAAQALEEEVRRTLRAADLVASAGENRLGVIVDCPVAHLPLIIQRVRGVTHNANVLIGWAARSSGRRSRDTIAAAEAALQTAIETNVPCCPPLEAQAMRAAPLPDLVAADRIGAALQKYVARQRDANQPVSILHLDVDFLRRYNEQYGWEAGDLLLREGGELQQRNTRATYLAGRGEEDEFFVATACNAQDALGVAQRVLAAARKATFLMGKTGLKMTFSIGVAGAPDHGATARQLLAHAAAALRVAQARGHGVAVLFGPEMMRVQKTEEPTDIF
jgi:diguanylate cyclase (GGDEF)-like protein